MALKRTGNGLDACEVCSLLETKPGFVQIEKKESTSPDEIDVLVWETELLINDEDAGFAIDWDFTDAEIFYELVLTWRNAEREIQRDRAFWHHAFIKGHFEKKK